jgi:hypothetical protein
MRRALASCSAVLLAVLPSLAAAQGQGANPAPAAGAPSEAERLLFEKDHLSNARSPRVLRYRYAEETGGKPPVQDQAAFTLEAGAAGRCCDVRGEYLSGAMMVSLPAIPDARSNPVLLYFLEGEVRRLQRTTKGQAAHFRRVIRIALADHASITDTPVRWGAKSVPARTVRVAPFLDDPYRGRFPDQAATEYAFVLSDAVPGGVYQLSATLPGAAGGPPLARRVLILEETKP